MDPTPVTLSLHTRSTELRSLTNDCSLRWFLDQTVPETEGPVVSYFTMGTVIHEAIEKMIEADLSLDDAIEDAQFSFAQALPSNQEIVWSSKRPDLDSCLDAIELCLNNWHRMTHPSSKDRHPLFLPYDWPPSTELYMEDTEHRIFSTADAIFYVEAILDNFKLVPSTLIVDWKTGMGKKADPLQLWFYFYIGKKQSIIPQDSEFSGVFAHLTHGTLQYAQPYPGDSYMDALLSRARMIKEGSHFIPEQGWYCNYCPWQETHCPLFTDRELSEILDAYSIVVE